MSLFAPAGAGGAAAAPASSSGVVFKAGKMTQVGTRVTANEAKGQITVKKDATGLLNLVWRDRGTNRQDDPVILFPGDAKFLRCKSCTTGRVIYLKFASGRREFFWLQEPDASKDEGLVQKLNNAINGTEGSSSAPSSGAAAPAGAMETDDHGAPGIEIDPDELEMLRALPEDERMALAENLGLGPEMLAALLGGGGAGGAGGGAAAGIEIDEDELEMLRALPEDERMALAENLGLSAEQLSALMDDGDSAPAATPAVSATPANPPMVSRTNPPPSASGVSFDSSQLQAVLAGAAGPDLTDVLTMENLEPLLSKPGFFDALKPFLPDGQNSTEADLRANLLSPQYQQALATFNAAIKSGELEAAMGQLGVNPSDVRQGGGGIRGLLHAIQKQADQSK